MSAFLGSLWFAGLALLAGYIIGQVFPMEFLTKHFKK